MLTRSIKKSEFKQKKLVVDATDIRMGKLVAMVASILLGKYDAKSVRYVPFSDHVVIKNIKKMSIHESKGDKLYYRHSMYPGGFRSETLASLIERNPEKLLKESIWGMLPKNRYGRMLLGNVDIVDGDIDVTADMELVQVK